MLVDFAKFSRTLPYASELYGIYQPLLGWRSGLQKQALQTGVSNLKTLNLTRLLRKFQPNYRFLEEPTEDGRSSFELSRGEPIAAVHTPLQAMDSVIARKVLQRATEDGVEDPHVWAKLTSPDVLDELLRESQDAIKNEFRTALRSIRNGDPSATLRDVLENESAVAGALAHLNASQTPEELKAFLAPTSIKFAEPLTNIAGLLTGGKPDLLDAAISPIGVVHLFRQYFFEFDTFLGPPVQHLWLSPGGTVELVEVSTRKTIVERTTEQLFDALQKSEKSSLNEDELSDSVRSENASDTKLGVTLTSTGSYGAGFIKGSTTVGASFDAAQTSKQAREQTHRALRQQTEKLSSEIRRSFKSTFRTVSETTDTQSRRYLIQNTGGGLVNYELRRKMRQVGVQVQDYGMQLCWQAYVDDPGKELGLANLVHVASPADLQIPQEPEALPMPEAEIKSPPVSLNIKWLGGKRNFFIPLAPAIQLTPPKPDYVFSRAEVVVSSGPPWHIRAFPERAEETQTQFNGQAAPVAADVEMIDAGDGTQEPRVRSVTLGAQAGYRPIDDSHDYEWSVQLSIVWRPARKLVREIQVKNEQKQKDFTAEKTRLFREALYKTARDRVKAASNIEPRRFEELREEERIIVYRNLIRTLLAAAGIKDEDPKVRHVFAELVESMFDIDKMLYFVAPEWWTPRRQPLEHLSPQDVGLGNEVWGFNQASSVSWGGLTNRPDNYYITEDSAPARMGSSLGWTLQLDGDNLRNAFLNAPWVKAVIPIRAGREWQALDWLQSDAIEGGDGLSAKYQPADPAEPPKMLAALKAHDWQLAALASRYANMATPDDIQIIDAIRYLIICVEDTHAKSLTPIPDPSDPTLNYLPTDEVFEHGFDPLIGGFKAQGSEPFKVFDQWVEVLPTDQIVPVEVEYNPKTGMQL